MTKQEFEKLCGQSVTALDYDTIEKVYTFHPSISERRGKQEIVDIYLRFGMRLIRDMLPTANEAERLEREIQTKRIELEEAMREYKEFKEDR